MNPGDMVVLVRWCPEPDSEVYRSGLRIGAVGTVTHAYENCNHDHATTPGPYHKVQFSCLPGGEWCCVPECLLRKIDPDRLQATDWDWHELLDDTYTVGVVREV